MASNGPGRLEPICGPVNFVVSSPHLTWCAFVAKPQHSGSILEDLWNALSRAPNALPSWEIRALKGEPSAAVYRQTGSARLRVRGGVPVLLRVKLRSQLRTPVCGECAVTPMRSYGGGYSRYRVSTSLKRSASRKTRRTRKMWVRIIPHRPSSPSGTIGFLADRLDRVAENGPPADRGPHRRPSPRLGQRRTMGYIVLTHIFLALRVWRDADRLRLVEAR
ncbi:hypothetical protein L7F22_041813 [Adiantum nelumboides]|nr:hypothetical protein [Adiantum nelumboides]